MKRRSKAERQELVTRQRVCSPSRVEAYKAKRQPECNRGLGCRACWAKWHIVNVRGGHDDRPAGTEGATP